MSPIGSGKDTSPTNMDTVTLNLAELTTAPASRAQARLILENDLEPYMSRSDANVVLLLGDMPPCTGAFVEELFGGSVRRWGPQVRDRLTLIAGDRHLLERQAIRYMERAIARYARVQRAEKRGWKFGTVGEFLGMSDEEEAYIEALVEIDQLMNALPTKGTEAWDRLNFLVELAEAYEDEHYPIDPPDKKARRRFHWDRKNPRLSHFRYRIEDFMKQPLDYLIMIPAYVGAAPHLLLKKISPKLTNDLRISMAITALFTFGFGLLLGVWL